jgi:hypothetical protein
MDTSIPHPTKIWGRDMTRATFRKFVEADAREARTNNNWKLAEALKASAEKEKLDKVSEISELTALEEFRVMRAFPTLLKIISKQGTENQAVDTGRFSRPLNKSPRKKYKGSAVSATSNGEGGVNNFTNNGAMLSIERMESASKRVILQFGDTIRLRNQRSYLRSEMDEYNYGKAVLEQNIQDDDSGSTSSKWCIIKANGSDTGIDSKQNIQYGVEFQIMLYNTKDHIKYLLCSNVRRNILPNKKLHYRTKVYIVDVNDVRAKGKASLWCFAGGAKGKDVLNNRQVLIRSMNCNSIIDDDDSGGDNNSDLIEGLLTCNYSKLAELHINFYKDDGSGVPSPQSAACCWFVEKISDIGNKKNNTNDNSKQQKQKQKQKITSSPIGMKKTSRPLVTPSSRSQSSPRSARNKSIGNRDRLDSDASMENRPAFSPCNPAKAKNALSRDGMYVSVGIPYSALADQQLLMTQKQRDNRLDGHFSATGHVGNRYINRGGQFLHSPDSKCIQMEQNFLKERAKKGLKLLHAKHINNHKHWLKHRVIKDDD